MSVRFERSGPLTEVNSYPQWTQDMVGECDLVKQTVVKHELWDIMRGQPGRDCTANFMIGIWPVIERFPGYMAQSLLKTRTLSSLTPRCCATVPRIPNAPCVPICSV